MSAEQFNHIENRIKVAAENSEPVYNEQAWVLMNARLDKERRRKKRFIYWWFLPALAILLSGIAGLSYMVNNKKVQVVNYTNPIKTPVNIKPEAISDTHQNKNEVISLVKNPHDHLLFNRSMLNKINVALSPAEKYTISNMDSRSERLFKTNLIKPEKDKISLKNPANLIGVEDVKKFNLLQQEVDSLVQRKPVFNLLSFEILKLSNKNYIREGALSPVAQNNKPVVVDGQKNKKEGFSRNQTTNHILNISDKYYLMGSIGADAASVKLFAFKNTVVAPKYGIGVGYQLNKLFSIQTGFYVSQKIYTAGPADYTPKNGSYWNQVQLLKVDANCKVYEIPITLRYDYIQKIGYAFYVTTGISGYIMKKEVYDYHFIGSYGYQQMGWTYTGNKNLFAVLSFSAGIEKKISKKLSVTSEAAVSLPLAGVGDGRVKLYSTVLQAGIKYRLHNKHPKN